MTLTFGDRTHVVGILNVTPDSFSDGGRYPTVERAIRAASDMLEAGASMVDIGGESTRPGSEPVPLEIELARTIPVIRELARRGLGPVSIDTYKAEVARQAVGEGAAVINDISGGEFEPLILSVAAEAKCPIILSHTRGRPATMQEGTWTYRPDVVTAVRNALRVARESAHRAGVQFPQIWLDPGIGFGKTLDENLALLRNLSHFKALDAPLLVGTSRKGFIGHLTGRDPSQRDYGTAASVALAIAGGADLVRVHDVPAMTDVVRVADAWVRGQEYR
ncbi:MAG: dihydropteroate synthase [Myxococcota bacterium]